MCVMRKCGFIYIWYVKNVKRMKSRFIMIVVIAVYHAGMMTEPVVAWSDNVHGSTSFTHRMDGYFITYRKFWKRSIDIAHVNLQILLEVENIPWILWAPMAIHMITDACARQTHADTIFLIFFSSILY